MRFNDAVTGTVLLLFGLAVAAYARHFPTLPNQAFGARLFPLVIGIALAACGAILVVKGIRERHRVPLAALGPWARSPHHLVGAALVLAALLGYILVADRLGFFLTAAILLALLMAWFRRGRIVSSVGLALAGTLAIDYAFSRLLLVPLPIGVFEPIGWLT